jgi:hypothetical protein
MIITFPTHARRRCAWTADRANRIVITIPKAYRKCNFSGWAITWNAYQWWLRCALIALFTGIALISTAPPALAQTSAPTHYFLVPYGSTAIQLHTHTADLDLGDSGVALLAAVDARYRLQNRTMSTAPITLKLIAAPASGPLNPPDNLTVLVNGQPLQLTLADDESVVVQLQVPADSTLDVRLTYAITLGDGPLVTVAYPIQPLRQWPGQPSLRVSLGVPDTIPLESRLRIHPEGWNYAPGEGTTPRIRWLYDPPLPETPFDLTLIHPATWQTVSEASAAATPGAPSAAFLRLGKLYTTLHDATDDAGLRDRFYAQAVAAYSAGLENSDPNVAPPPDQAELHAGLAALYRSRSVGADGAVERTYMELMAGEADRALAGLPAEHPQRGELLQWQVEGLTLQLEDARNQRNWPAAFAVLERLATLPPGVVDAATLAETRRALIVQQGLQLLEEGDNDAAMQLAGAQVSSADLLPPANALPLFVTWQVTATIAPAQLGLILTIQPAAGRQAEAQAALEALIQTWEEADEAGEFSISLAPAPATEGDAGTLHLTLTMPASGGAATLARITPPGADWALVRTLLAQLAPRVERSGQLLNQQIRISQPLDLRSTYEQWTSVAATLDQQADQLEAQSPNLNLASVETVVAETALVTRIKAANYRATALAWRTLARNSLVAVQMSAGVGVPPVTRVWLSTPETPLQTLSLEANVLSLGRLLVVAGIAFGGLFLLAGALWSML